MGAADTNPLLTSRQQKKQVTRRPYKKKASPWAAKTTSESEDVRVSSAPSSQKFLENIPRLFGECRNISFDYYIPCPLVGEKITQTKPQHLVSRGHPPANSRISKEISRGFTIQKVSQSPALARAPQNAHATMTTPNPRYTVVPPEETKPKRSFTAALEKAKEDEHECRREVHGVLRRGLFQESNEALAVELRVHATELAVDPADSLVPRLHVLQLGVHLYRAKECLLVCLLIDRRLQMRHALQSKCGSLVRQSLLSSLTKF